MCESATAGVPSVVFGPGFIEQAHTEDEWLPLDQLEAATEIHDILGAKFCMIFDEVKREEMQLFHKEISPWEREHLLLNV